MTRIKETKEKANNEAKDMMRTLMNQQKLSDYTVCYTSRLLNFKDTKFVHDLCFKYYGASGVKYCEDRKEFCTQCCGFHVGINYSGKLFDCQKKCTKVVSGIPAYNDSKIEEEKSKKHKKNKK